MKYAAPAAMAVFAIVCMCIGIPFVPALVLGAAAGVGVKYVQDGGFSKKPAEGGDKPAVEKAEGAAAKPAEKPKEAAEKPKEGEKPQFKEGEEPEHFHDNDELAARAKVHRDKARQLRDEAHMPENRDRKSQLHDEADAEDRIASDMIFEELQKKQEEGTIDLHLQFVAEALRITEEQSEILKGKGFTEMVIITGKGNHSEGGVCKIAPAIENWAKEKGYTQEPGEGKITVRF